MSLGTVSELWRYPVKSMAGQKITECVVQEIFGIPGDRGRAIWDVEAGEIRSAKKIPALLQCVARYREEPSGHSISPVEITLPDSQEIESEDPGISAALSKALGREVRLCVRRPPEDLAHYRRAEKITDMGSEIREQCGLLPGEPLPEMGDIPPELLEFVSPPGTYFDGFPLHLITTASIRELARLAPASRIDVPRTGRIYLVRSVVVRRLLTGGTENAASIYYPLRHRFARIHDESREGFELISGGPGDLGCEFPKVVEAFVTQSMYDGPINILIGMHCDISKADRRLHLARERFIDDSQFGERVKYASHRFRSRKRGIRNHNGRDVDANLYGSCEIERDDILKIRIRRKLRYFFGTPTADSLDAALQGLQFLVD